MFPLWNSIILQLKTIQKRPSPKHNNHIQSSAQSSISFQDKNTPNLFRFPDSIKETSLCISRNGMMKASMTVEAAIAVPIFLFFFLNLMISIELIRLHGNLQLALWETGNRMTLYGGILSETDREEGQREQKQNEQVHSEERGKTDALGATGEQGNTEKEESWWKELAGVVWSYTYVKSQIIEYLGKDYLEQSPLADGTDSLHFLESHVFEDKDCFEVIVTYSVSPLCSISGFRPFRMANRYYGHLWNGYELPGTEETYVYVTENGAVYHVDRDCTHLKLSVRLVTWQQACVERNENGKKYVACEKCTTSDIPNAVYITNEGDCYHFVRDCPGLKRTVSCIPISQAKELRPCQRCA